MAYSPNIYFSQTGSQTVANTTTETSLVDSGVGFSKVLANSVNIGDSFIFLMCGYHSAISNPTITIKVKLNSTTILTTGIVTIGNATNEYFEIRGNVTVRTIGASGSIFPQGFFYVSGNGGNSFSMVNTSAVTVDSTIDQQGDITVTWGTASASNTITATNFTIRKTS